MIETIFSKALEAFPWVFSGVGIPIARNTAKKIFNSQKKNSQNVLENTFQDETVETKEEPYSVRLGKRLKLLREDYFKLNEREMADFYGYEEVAELTKYESGEKEFPRESIKKLQNFFFVSKKFIEEGGDFIFECFDLYSDDVKNLLQSGFKPYFLCSSSQREDFYTYPVFYKQENNISRVVIANLTGSFMSSGGGYLNIAQIIKAMLVRGMRDYDAFILKVDEQTWQSLDKCTFYRNNMYFSLGRDDECREIFNRWFQDLEEEMYPERHASLKKFFESVYGSDSDNL